MKNLVVCTNCRLYYLFSSNCRLFYNTKAKFKSIYYDLYHWHWKVVKVKNRHNPKFAYDDRAHLNIRQKDKN